MVGPPNVVRAMLIKTSKMSFTFFYCSFYARFESSFWLGNDESLSSSSEKMAELAKVVPSSSEHKHGCNECYHLALVSDGKKEKGKSLKYGC